MGIPAQPRWVEGSLVSIPDSMSKDGGLVERLKAKSPEAFEALVADYARRLYSVSFRILRNPPDAEDAVQETFLSALENIEDFREESSLYTWLYRIVCNRSLAKLRRPWRDTVVSIEEYLPHFEQGQHLDQIVDWTEVPELRLRIQELAEFFEKCIDELPADLRVAYILKDVEKLPEDQVCEILGITKPTAKNRVHRARLVIRKRVADHFFGKNSRAPRVGERISGYC